MYTWCFDVYTEIRVLKPSTIDNLRQFGIDLEVNEKERYARFSMTSGDTITQKAIPFDVLRNAAVKKTLTDKAEQMFAAQVEESRKMVSDGIIKDPSVMHEVGEVYHVPITVINETREHFNKAPQDFISFAEVDIPEGVKAIIGKVTIEFTGRHYHFEEETHARESTFLFLAKKDQTIAMQEFERSNQYAFFKNKEGLVYFLVNQYGYEGGGSGSYLVDQNGIQLIAAAGSGV